MIPDDAAQAEAEGFDPSGRALCRDETCIGLIGPDGRCKLCGLPGDVDSASVPAPGAPPRVDPHADPAPATAAEAIEDADAREGEDDFSDRRLCPDDRCIGVLGEDGRCRVCGAASAAAPAP